MELRYRTTIAVKKMLKLKLNPEGQGRQPPTDQPQPPAASTPAAAFTLEKFEFLYFDFVYK